MNKYIAIVVATISIFLSACGDAKSISGSYVSHDGDSMTFENGKIKSDGREGDFQVVGETLKFKFQKGHAAEAKINSDGSFTTSYGYTYKKVN